MGNIICNRLSFHKSKQTTTGAIKDIERFKMAKSRVLLNWQSINQSIKKSTEKKVKGFFSKQTKSLDCFWFRFKKKKKIKYSSIFFLNSFPKDNRITKDLNGNFGFKILTSKFDCFDFNTFEKSISFLFAFNFLFLLELISSERRRFEEYSINHRDIEKHFVFVREKNLSIDQEVRLRIEKIDITDIPEIYSRRNTRHFTQQSWRFFFRWS